MQGTRNELFETFDDAGNPTGLVPRADVHRLGLWHRSAQVFLFTAQGRLIVHERAAQKDLYASQWDHSVGEHLQPGESFAQGAARGLREEYGLRGVILEPLGSERRQAHRDPAGCWHDREIQHAYRATWQPAKHGELTPQASEIQAVEFVAFADLPAWMRAKAGRLTPWFEEDLRFYKLLP